MKGESIVSIELAVGAAVFVLGARLFALIQATRGVPDTHRQVVEAISTGDLKTLQSRTRGLGYRNPYGEVAAALIGASQREVETTEERGEILKRAADVARRRIGRRTQQGQAMDLVAFSVALGLVVFSQETLPGGPIFWLLAGAVMILLLSSMVARGQLKASVLGSLESLQSVLVSRPQLPSLSGGPVDCFWCGERTENRAYDVCDPNTGERDRVLAAVCGSCGKFVATLSSDEPDSSVEPVSS